MISDDIAEQTAQTFRNIEVLLEAGRVAGQLVSSLVRAQSLCEPLCDLALSRACSSRSLPSLEPPSA
jgi:hypothetical protein